MSFEETHGMVPLVQFLGSDIEGVFPLQKTSKDVSLIHSQVSDISKGSSSSMKISFFHIFHNKNFCIFCLVRGSTFTSLFTIRFCSANGGTGINNSAIFEALTFD